MPFNAPPAKAVAQAYGGILRRRLFLIALFLAAIAAFFIADFSLGPSGLPFTELMHTLLKPSAASDMTRVIVWDIRLPSALMAVVVGMALGLAGAEMQTVLNNPLASPFTLGLSSAAAFGASLAIVLRAGIPGIPIEWFLTGNAFLMAILCALLLDLVTRWGGINTSGVVLFGIALVFTFNALVALMQFTASAEALQSLVFWTMGNLSSATWPKIGVLAVAFTLVFSLAMGNAWRLTALRLGEDRAASFGVNVKRLRLGALIRISLLAGLAVAFVGTIGFIGLVAPHIARRLWGEDHRFYLPGSALTGATILSLAAVVSKHMVPGVVLPVGIVTALVGIPFFLSVVIRRPLL